MLTHIPIVHSNFPIHSTSWRWISAGRMFFTFKNPITESTSQSAGLIIGMLLYKELSHSNQFTQWLGQSCERGKGSDDSSRPSKPPVNYLRGKSTQTVLTLKITLVKHPNLFTVLSASFFRIKTTVA
jgi:hypothetical protein